MVNLPAPSKELISAVYEDLNDKLSTHQYFWETDSNWPLGLVENVAVFNHTNIIGTEEYQPLFKEKINVCGLLFQPDTRTTISELPPHTDIGRIFGINYVLETGGDNVTTTIYKQIESSDVPVVNFPSRDSLDVLKTYCLEKHNWYGLDGLRYHSVENLTKKRLLLSISFENMKFADFKHNYNDIINDLHSL